MYTCSMKVLPVMHQTDFLFKDPAYFMHDQGKDRDHPLNVIRQQSLPHRFNDSSIAH